MRLNGQAGRLIARSVREARRLASQARARARGRGAGAKLRAAAGLEELATRCQRVARQIEQRLRGERIEDRLVSLADPAARPIRKGKLGKPNEFGYVAQIAEVAPDTRRGARGFLLPPASLPGNPAEVRLLPTTAQELEQLGVRPREIACDGAFNLGPTAEILAPLGAELYVAGRAEPGGRRTRKRLARFRTGVEGRISHLKRGYGLRRSRLKGYAGARIWSGWAVLAYNLDTYGHYA